MILVAFSENIKKINKIFYIIFFLLLAVSILLDATIRFDYFSVNLIPFILFFVMLINLRISQKRCFNKKIYIVPILLSIIYLIIININIKFNYEINLMYVAIFIGILNLLNLKNFNLLIYGMGLNYLFIEIANTYFFIMEFEYANICNLSFLNAISLSMCLDFIVYFGLRVVNKYAKKQKEKIKL